MTDSSMGFVIERRWVKGGREYWFEIDRADDIEDAQLIADQNSGPTTPCRIRPAPRWMVLSMDRLTSYGDEEPAQAARRKLAEHGIRSTLIPPHK